MTSVRENSLEEVALIFQIRRRYSGENTVEGRHSRKPEENKGAEVLGNSVCMETAASMKAENDERWDQFGVELKEKKEYYKFHRSE